MAVIQLDKMSVKDLVDLDVKVKKAVEGARERERVTVKQKLDAILENAGLGVEDIAELYGLSRGRGARKGTKVAPKYRNPDNRSETWTGRGRPPRWLAAKIKQGSKREDFAI